jgi:O-antigen/teichoic acid export membrane protein
MLQTEIAAAEPLSSSHTKAEPEPPSGSAGAHVLRRARELAWVIAGKLVMMGANAALMLLLAARLELNVYGLLVTTISGQLLLSRVALLGVERGVIRLRTLPELSHQAGALFNAGLAVIRRMSALLILFALIAIWVWSYSAPSLDPQWVVWMIVSMAAGAIGTALVDFGYGVYLSQVQYRAAALQQGGTALARMVVTSTAVLIWPHHPLLVFLAYPCASLASGLAQARLIRSAGGGHSLPDRALVRRLLRYSLWPGGTNFIVVLYLYQGTFILTWLGQQAEAGVFGLGLTLSLGFLAVCQAFTEFLLTRVSRAQSLPPFLWRAFGSALVLALGSVPVVLGVGWLISELAPSKLPEVAPIFYLLSASMLSLLFHSPLDAACHYLLRPQLAMFGMIFCVICSGGLAWLWAPSQGAWGMAAAQLCGTVIALVVFGACVFLALRATRSV